MTVLGAHVPLSGWTLLGLMVSVVLSLALWPLARRAGWRPGWALAALLSAGLALALTVTPEPGLPVQGVAACIPYDWNDLLYNVLYTGGGVFAGLLNLLLLLPLAVSLVLATRRAWPAVLTVVALPWVIEAIQTQLPGRACTVSDILANVAGGALGIVLAASWLRGRESAGTSPAGGNAP